MISTHEAPSAGSDDAVVRLLRNVDEGALPAAPDGAVLAGAAVRRVRIRRTVFGATTGMLAVGALGVALHVTPSVLQQEDVLGPGSGWAAADGASSPASTVRYLATGGGELPELPGLRHGVMGQFHNDYTLAGGITYTTPSGGGWELREVSDADAAPEAATWDVSTSTLDPMGGSGATIAAAVADDAASWQVPARDSGAWTADVPGADLVVVTRGPSAVPERELWEVRVRAGETGWVFRLDFTADKKGAELATAFVGNLWIDVDGQAPAWFDPTWEDHIIDGIVPGTPEGWQDVSLGGVTFAVPADWTRGDDTAPCDCEEYVEMWGDHMADLAGPVHWRVLAESRGTGEVGDLLVDGEAQDLTVPGTDEARLRTTTGPHWADSRIDSYSADIQLQGTDGGENILLIIELPHDDEGLATLRGILGSLRMD